MHRSALDLIEDHCPQAMPSDILTSESALFLVDSSDPNQESYSLLSDSHGNQKAHSMAQKLQQTETNLLREQERTAAVIAKYRSAPLSFPYSLFVESILRLTDPWSRFRKSLQRAETELEKKASEVSLLTERLEIMTAHANEKKRGSDEVNDKFDNVSKRLEAQMQELRKKEGQNPESKKQIAALRAQCSLLEEENREMRSLLLRRGGGGAGNGKEGGQSLEAYLKQLEDDPDNAILQQVYLVPPFLFSWIHLISFPVARSGVQECLSDLKVLMDHFEEELSYLILSLPLSPQELWSGRRVAVIQAVHERNYCPVQAPNPRPAASAISLPCRRY
jgi:hypothetical protein